MNRFLLLFVLVFSVELIAQTSRGNALDFDGIDDYVSLSIPSNTSFANGFTYTSWVKWDTFPSASRLIDLGNGSESNNIVIRNSTAGGILIITVLRSNATTRSLTTPQSMEIGAWTHVAFTIAASATDTSVASIYINGQSVATGTITMPKDTVRSTNYFGKSNWDNPYFNGAMDEMSIWNKALTQSQVDSARLFGLTGSESGLLAYYKCNQGTATGANTGITSLTNSASGSSITNTLNNFAMSGPGSNFFYLLEGNGTDAKPYLLYTYTDLKHIDENLTATYHLMADIDATPSWTENSGRGFTPIGLNASFSGKFNGHDHVIKNLYIHRPDSAKPVGFFASIQSAKIDSVRLEKCTITGPDYVGGITGYNVASSIIQSCFVSGSITGLYAVGGLVGYSLLSSDVISCGTAGSVRGTGQDIGGLVGRNNGSRITSSYSTSSVYGGSSSQFVGGLVGTSMESSFIDDCYATGPVTGYAFVGGLAGSNQQNTGSGAGVSQIQNCYATGQVSGGEVTGGLVGANYRARILSCYATGSISGSAPLGGLVGTNPQGEINLCYWNSTTSGQASIKGDTAGIVTNCMRLTTAQMKAPQSFPYWNFSSTWIIRPDSTYPALRKVSSNAPFAFRDSLVTTTRTYSLTNLLLNDYDYETIQQHLVLKVQSASAGTTDSTSTLTFSSTLANGAVDTVKYRVGEIRASRGDTLWGNVATAIIFLIAPSVPVLVSPANNTTSLPIAASYKWNKVTGADSYRLQIATDSLFTSTASQDSTLTDTTKSGILLEFDTKYFWRVCAKNAAGTSAWSTANTFRTIVATPGVPSPISPADNTANSPITTSYTWTKVTGSTSYRFQVATDSLFTSNMSQDSTLTDTIKTGITLANNTKYFWRVNATNAGGAGAWSTVNRFTTIVALPVAVTLKTPAAGDTIKVDSTLLSWTTATPTTDRYRVEYATDSVFTSPTSDSAVTDTSKMIRGLSNNTSVWWRVKAHNAAGWGEWSTKSVFVVKFPSTSIRYAAIPKTFTFGISGMAGSIRYGLPNAEQVSLQLYSVKGQLVANIVNMQQPAGYYSVNFRNGLRASGSYLVVFKAGNYMQKKMIYLMK